MAPQKTPKSEVKNDAHDARRFGPQTPSEMEPIFDPKSGPKNTPKNGSNFDPNSGSENGLQNDPISRFKSDVERAVSEGIGEQVKRALDRPISARLDRRLMEQAWALTDGGRRDPMPVFLPAGEEGRCAKAT